MALYLKYRPQSLDQLIGQEIVKKTLSEAFQNQKLSHAYLFVGPRGTGKTSTARILAKMVNCEAKDAPCNKCQSCLSITDGSNLDLIEIDAASNRGIDDIRSLRENIKLATSSAKKKVYIIDEVHMLTTEAFNALLKTLEEPPSHVLFILATTEAQKIPATILSRAQRLDFKLANQKDLIQTLKEVSEAEKIEIEEMALAEIAKSANGSFRDGVKLLDQLSSAGKKIEIEDVSKILHGNSEDLFELLEFLADRDAKKSLIFISKQVSSGSDIKLLVSNLLSRLRDIFLFKNGLGEDSKLDALTQKFSTAELQNSMDSLLKAQEQMKYSSIPSLPLEIAVVEICGTASQQPQEVAETLKTDTPTTDIPKHRNTDIPISSDTPNSDISKLQEKWTFVLETIRPYNFSLEALLRSVKILECNDMVVTLEVPYSFHQRILEAPKNKDLLEGTISEVLGRAIKVTTQLGVKPQRIEELANIEVAADDEIVRAAAEIFSSETIN